MSLGDDARHTHPRVSHDLVEVPGRVSVPEVRGPAAEEPVDVPHDPLDRQQQPPSSGQFPDPITSVLHCLARRPTSQEHDTLTGPAPTLRAHQPVMKAQEVKPWLSDL